MGELSFETEEHEVETDLDSIRKLQKADQEKELDPDFALAKFALLRWDEMEELAACLAAVLRNQSPVPSEVSSQLLRDALKQVADSEWRKNKSYVDYLRDTKSERKDYQMLNIWKVNLEPLKQVLGLKFANGTDWLPIPAGAPAPIDTSSFNLQFDDFGCVQITAK